MSKDSPFSPELGGNTVLVGVTPVQVMSGASSQNQVQNTSYRIRCLVAGYLAWNPQVTGNALPVFSATAPAAGVPSVNTIGMSVGQTEVLDLGNNVWFLSSVAAAFEISAGEGV